MSLATKARMGYSLLELMLALTLLAALMAVGWSLLGTYRDAEMRGWRLAHRTQTLRTLRDSLEGDLQQIISPADTQRSLPSTLPSPNLASSLVGSASGFVARCTPSLDPLPFLEKWTESSEAGLRSSGIEDTAWPSESIDVEYRLTPISPSDSGSKSLLADPTADVVSVLTRREHSVAGSNPDSADGAFASPAERTLTARDLYRQTETAADLLGPQLRESQWWGLTRAEFQYFDGQAWQRQWNSLQSGTLPQAIAVSFDFVNNDQLKPPSRPTPSLQGDDANAEFSMDNFQALPTFADAALAEEPQAASTTKPSTSLAASGTHQVQMVVVVEQAMQVPHALNSLALPGRQRTTPTVQNSDRSGGLP